jgi:hypothetical protein
MSMSNKTAFTVIHNIACCPDAMERGYARSVSGRGIAKSRSMLRAIQRARKLACADMLEDERKCRAAGEEPAQSLVMDDGDVFRNGEHIGLWNGRRLEVPMF